MSLTPDLQDGPGLRRGQLCGQVENLLAPRRKVAHCFLRRKGGEEGRRGGGEEGRVTGEV